MIAAAKVMFFLDRVSSLESVLQKKEASFLPPTTSKKVIYIVDISNNMVQYNGPSFAGHMGEIQVAGKVRRSGNTYRNNAMHKGYNEHRVAFCIVSLSQLLHMTIYGY